MSPAFSWMDVCVVLVPCHVCRRWCQFPNQQGECAIAPRKRSGASSTKIRPAEPSSKRKGQSQVSPKKKSRRESPPVPLRWADPINETITSTSTPEATPLLQPNIMLCGNWQNRGDLYVICSGHLLIQSMQYVRSMLFFIAVL